VADVVLRYGDVLREGGFNKRYQEIKPGELADEVYIQNGATAAVSQQRFFLAGSGRLTLGAAGNFRALLRNPSASGRNLYLVRLALLSTALAWGDVRVNPTTGLPTAARTSHNAILGAAAASGELLADVNAITAIGGGTLLSTTIAVPVSQRVQLDLPPFVLAPGVSVGLNFNVLGAADASISGYWYEENV
jgi:hypothetical protein